MAAELIFITGGIRSGKSRFAREEAARLAGDSGRVTFIATAEEPGDDPDMAARIARHRAERPDHWHTVESTTALAESVREADAEGAVVLIDCLTLWVSRIIAGTGDPESDGAPDRARAAVEPLLEDLLTAISDARAAVVVVTNEVGSGVAPATRLGNLFADLLGEVNRDVAAASDHAYLLAAGLPLRLK